MPLKEAKYWSDPNTWPDKLVPSKGNILIPPGENIIYDVKESPLFDVITVNGQLSFIDDVEKFPTLNLNTKYIFVRVGKLFIGSEDKPFQGKASINLFGSKTDATILMSGTVEAGNKIIANTGLVEFHGKPRNKIMTRLLTPVFKGDTKALVEQNLDWVAGEKLYFAPTNTQPTHHDYLEIEEYIADTGLLKLKSAFLYYHYGGDSTGIKKYKGVDVRGEVILLSRNIKVIGDSSNDWGCAIVTADRTEFDKTVRIGRMVLENVEVYRCGQENTFKAAIRFEAASKADVNTNKVINSVVWGGNAHNLYIKASRNIEVTDTAFLGGINMSVILQTTNNVHLNRIFVGDNKKRKLSSS